MDVDNVSEVPQYIQILLRQKAALNAAMARRGQRPKDMKSRRELIDQFMIARVVQEMTQFRTGGSIQLHTSFVPIPYEPSITPLGKLKPVYIKDLRLETHHRGNYLLVRVLTPPHRMTAIMAIVEDENAGAVPLQIYQQPDEKIRPATSVIMKNDVLLIKEPYLKTTSDGGYGLRVDHVSDLVCLDAHCDMLPNRWKSRPVILGKTADDWKQEGNEAMGKKDYWAAIQSYTAALECPSSAQVTKTIHLNRALAHLKDASFDAALTDSQCMISLSDASEKALYRAGQALYGLGRFSECRDMFESLCKKYPNNSLADTELKRVCCRLAEQQSGIYDFESIYKEISTTRPPHLDHATFVGSVVVKPSPGRGLGMFTTKAVEAGELLLCEKAFAHCYAGTSEDSEINSKITLLMNVHTNKMTMGTQSDLITNIVQKLWKNPSLLPKFTELHHGSYKPTEVAEVDEKPVVDTFLIEHIIALNSFGCPLSSHESYFTSPKEADHKHHSCGIWLMASKINHSCLSNAHRSFLGDLQLVRATCDIPTDTELTFWYALTTGESNEMKYLKNWGFQCKCPICLDSEETSKRQLRRRSKLLEELKMTLDASNINTTKAERLLIAIDGTYKHPATRVPRLALRYPYLQLAGVYAKRKMAEKVVSMTLKALKCLGFVIKDAYLPAISGKPFVIEKWGLMMDGVMEAWIYLCDAYAALAPQFLQQAEDCAKLAYKMCIGEDHTFKKTYDAKARHV
ncbi:hypothetical protein SBOR_1354 [Sclerotinia borealis F-4128]|uniref:SET domain-containing protein n=1 Tax=Sclerotinia borealis (strain F-4128) TaxID=1432307 RepID=W9CQC9_SCLBF|nr:hypothetical protein SBOR_1354 [Sclerotinia borealis F-4128]